MDKELQKLIDKINNDRSKMGSVDLEAAIVKLREKADAITDPDDADLEALEAIAAAIEQAQATIDERTAAATERDEKAKAIRERIAGPAATAEEDPEAPEGDEPVVPEAEVKDLVPVAAAVVPVVKVKSRTIDPAFNARPGQVTPASVPDASKWGMVAAANVPGFSPGEKLDDAEKIARAFMAGVESLRGYKGVDRTFMALARLGSEDCLGMDYDDDHMLGSDSRGNFRKIQAAKRNRLVSERALVASGGIQTPSPLRYDLPILPSTDARPVRDQMLERFGADRGGVQLMPPPVLTDLDDAVDQWTEANDQTPSNPSTKPCLTVAAPSEHVETLVYAITRCLKYGNFRARYFGEQIEAWMTLLGANWARFAETTLLTEIGNLSTATTHGQGLGSFADLLAGLDLALAGLDSRHRLADGTDFMFGAPRWLKRNLRVDLARQMPSGSWQERLAAADNDIETVIRARGVRPVWLLDGETGQVFGPQGDGPLNGWPSTAVTYLYVPGEMIFLDGGTLDLGLVRDATLIGTNDVEFFAESFENVAFHGTEAERLTFDLCPSGTAQELTDWDPCSTGS